jgi:hypothetical protein
MIVVTPNRITFLANQATLPLFFLGFWHPQRRAGIALIICAFLHSITVGHLNSFILCLLFLTLWQITQATSRKGEQENKNSSTRWEPLHRFLAGGVVSGVILSPLLLSALSGFFSMNRNVGAPPEFSRLLAMPAPVFFTSFFSGCFASFFGEFGLLFIPTGLSSAIALAPAAYWVFHSLGARRKPTPTEIACVVTAAFVALCVVRPDWVAQFFSRIPLLRSTRMPFREVFAFLFFIHLWIALRPVTVSPLLLHATTLAGLLFYLGSLALFRPPAITPMPLDRMLLISGKADRYWAEVRVLTQGNGLLLPVIFGKIPVADRSLVPWSLMNAYNYPALSGIPSRSGYIIRDMIGARYAGTEPLGPIGCFYQRDIALLRRADPQLRFIVLRSLEPVRIELWDGSRRVPLPVPPLPRVSANRWDLIPR